MARREALWFVNASPLISLAKLNRLPLLFERIFESISHWLTRKVGVRFLNVRSARLL